MKKCLLMLCVAAMVVACTTSPTGRNQLILIGDGEMAQMGITAFNKLKQQGDLSRNRRANQYVQCVSDAVLSALGPNAERWEVVVFDEDSPNAFALPGGKIGVHTGIMKVAENQSQLATVIGHEIAHVVSRHGAERVSNAFAAQAALGVAQAYANSSGKPQGQQQLLLAALGLGAQVGYLLPFGRTQESEADVIGLKMMAEAGFDPTQSVELWRNMKRASGGRSAPEFLSTHPNPDKRIQELSKYMDNARQIALNARRNGRNPNCG